MNTTFSIKKAFKDSFSLMWNNLGFVAQSFFIVNGTMLATLAVLFPLNLAYNKAFMHQVFINGRFNPIAVQAAVKQLVNMSKYLFSTSHTSLLFISMCVFFVVMLTLTMGLLKAILHVNDGETVSVKDFYAFFTPRSILKILVLTGLLIVSIVAGLAALIIPGIILMIRFYLAIPLFADKQLGPIEALKESWRLTSGKALGLFGFIICSTLILLPFNLIPFSYMITSIISIFFIVSAYRQLVPRS